LGEEYRFLPRPRYNKSSPGQLGMQLERRIFSCILYNVSLKITFYTANLCTCNFIWITWISEHMFTSQCKHAYMFDCAEVPYMETVTTVCVRMWWRQPALPQRWQKL
jgi:hypothetical protein